MVKFHRETLASAGAGPAVMLDTPFGFQVNADDLTEKIGEYFTDSVGRSLEVARWRRREDPVADRERALALIGRSAWAFSGPGSPSYALRQWTGTSMPGSLRDLVGRGGTLVMGSAAAATVGRYAVPVYEIYKVGLDPYWEEGLDLLGALTGISAAVIPHYDNREGGRHDTRYCYLGEERLVGLEADLPSDVGVLGVDEHTAVVIDLDAKMATVHGAGGLTLRHRDQSAVVPAGQSIPLADLEAAVRGEAALHGGTVSGQPPTPRAPAADVAEPAAGGPSLRALVGQLRSDFDSCLASGNADGALAAALELEDAIHAWSADTLQGDDIDVARAALRAMLVDLAGVAVSGMRDDRDILAPLVGIALELRQRAREAKDFAASDLIRDLLAEAGIDVRDTATGQEWHLVP